MANKFLDLNGGSDANNGSTFALRKKTLSSAAAVAVAGDVIRVMGKPSTNSGTATWTKGSANVTLSAAMTQALYSDGAWTPAANVTATANTTAPTPKQGVNASKLVCAAGFTTGLVAYFPTGSALNLSAYQQVSFWIYSTAALASGTLSLNLCSDVAGATIVNTMALNIALNANQWTAVTISNGAAFGASIQSIRLTANTTMASKTVLLDCIFAAKSSSSADCLTLNTLVSNDNATWHSVQNVVGTAVQIDGQQSTAAGAAKGFQGTTGSTTFSLLQPTQSIIGTGSSVYAQVFSGNGTLALPILVSGGWDSTAMSSQTGWTTLDMLDWSGSGINLTGTTGYVTVDKFNFAHAAFPLGLVTSTAKGLGLTNSGCAGTGSFSGMPTHGMNVSGSNFVNCSGTNYILDIPATANYSVDLATWNVANTKIWGSTVGGVRVPPFVGSPAITISGSNCSGNVGIGFDIQSPCNFRNNTALNNGAPGVNFQSLTDMAAYSVTARNNVTGEIQVNANIEIYGLDTNSGAAVPQIFFPNNTGGKATVYSWTQYVAGVLTKLGSPATGQTANNTVSSQKEGGTAGNNSIYSDYGVITTTGVVGQPGSGIAWKLSPNANALASSPLRLNVGKVACPANVPTTIKYWAKFSVAGPSAQLRVFGGRYAGVGSAGTDIVSAAVSGTAFAQYSVTFTPTENCVVDLFFEVWGSSTQNAIISGPVVVSQ